jgi:hypothetical protein
LTEFHTDDSIDQASGGAVMTLDSAVTMVALAALADGSELMRHSPPFTRTNAPMSSKRNASSVMP